MASVPARRDQPALASVADLPRKVRSVAQRWRLHPADALALIRTVEQAQSAAAAAKATERATPDGGAAEPPREEKAHLGSLRAKHQRPLTTVSAHRPLGPRPLTPLHNSSPLPPLSGAVEEFGATASATERAATTSPSPQPPSAPKPTKRNTTTYRTQKLPTIATIATTSAVSG